MNFLITSLKNFLYFGRELAKPEKLKKITLKKFLLFRERELFSPKLYKNFVFFSKKVFLIFQEMERSSPKLKKLPISQEGTFELGKQTKKKTLWKKFLYFTRNVFLISWGIKLSKLHFHLRNLKCLLFTFYALTFS